MVASSTAVDATLATPTFTHGRNDLLFDVQGRAYIDLFVGHGTAFLGHAHPGIVQALATQASAVWTTGGLDSTAAARARERVEALFPATHRLAGLYSTGMEAAEFAIRFVRRATGRNVVLGFDGAMHGKSMATAAMGWDNRDGLVLGPVRRLPCMPAASEDQMLAAVDAALAQGTVAALFVEPILGSRGGHRLGDACLNALQASCRRHGALLVVDEILTGLHRTGPAFVHAALDRTPDVVLLGKALGNGFPVSAVVTSREHPVVPDMLPGSTYAGNPLAAAVVSATLETMARLDLEARVTAIETCVRRVLGPLQTQGVALRGAGALWVLELPDPARPLDVVLAAGAEGVLVNHAGRQLRLLPAATTEPGHLERGCRIVADAIGDAVRVAR